MFDISEKLVTEQDEISGLETIGWENHSWKYLSLIGDERVINRQRTKVYVFSVSVLCLGKILENTLSNDAWDQRLGLGWLKSSQNYRNFDRIDGEPLDFEWNISPGYTTLQLNEEVKHLLLILDETPENFTGRILFTSMFNDISCGTKDNEEECVANARLVSLYAKRLAKDNGHSLVLVLKRSGILWKRVAHKESWTKLQKGCCWNSLRADVQFSILRLHCPEVNSKSKGHGKLSIHCAADQETILTIFRISVSANQPSLYGAVAEICEEYESLHERTGRPVVMGQSSSSLVLSAIKTEVRLECDDPANQDLLLQQYEERIEELSQQDKLSKFCMDAGFLNVVEIGQYFMTKDTAEFSQFHAVACREYTLPREEEAS